MQIKETLSIALRNQIHMFYYYYFKDLAILTEYSYCTIGVKYSTTAQVICINLIISCGKSILKKKAHNTTSKLHFVNESN